MISLKKVCLCIVVLVVIFSACASPQQADGYDSDISAEEYAAEAETEVVDTPTDIEPDITEVNDTTETKEPGFFGDIDAHSVPLRMSSPSRGFSNFFDRSDYRSTYVGGYFYPAPALGGVYRFCTVQDRGRWHIPDEHNPPPDPALHLSVDGIFFRPTPHGYIITDNSRESISLIDRDTGAILRHISRPWYEKPFGGIVDVAGDLSSTLFSYQRTYLMPDSCIPDFTYLQEIYTMNGVFLMEYPSMVSRQIMPGDYVYTSVRLVNDDSMVVAIRIGDNIEGDQLVLYDIQTGEFRVVRDMPHTDILFNEIPRIFNYWVIYNYGFYDVRQGRWVDVDLPRWRRENGGLRYWPTRYTVSHAGLVYYFNTDDNLMELNPQTGQERFIGYSIEGAADIRWMRSDCPNAIVGHIFMSGVYRFEVE